VIVIDRHRRHAEHTDPENQIRVNEDESPGYGIEPRIADRPAAKQLHSDGISSMLLKANEYPILAFSLIYICVFTGIALSNSNHEFVLYAGVVLVVCAWILWKQARVRFEPVVLWGLSVWGLLHMAGGNIRVCGDVLYGLQLIPVVLRYDQLVHAFGFGVATLACYHLLHPYLKVEINGWVVLSILIVLMGSGIGAVNEIVEYIAVCALPETGVGGYDNTMTDLLFNLIGGVLATGYLAWRRRSAALSDR